jgi:hypothetical protein
MNSATSTKPSFRAKPEAAAPSRQDDDAGFKPWHFFVLASLAAATAAVVLSRQSTPEHLILMSFTIGAAGVAAAALYRMLAPLAVRDVALLNERRSDRARAATEREKALVLRSIKELEFDRAMGKVSARDFDEMAGRLRARALMLLKQIDEGGAGYRELIERELRARLARRADGARAESEPGEAPLGPDAGNDQPRLDPATAANRGRGCAGCGTSNDRDAAFCKRCGTRLEAVRA